MSVDLVPGSEVVYSRKVALIATVTAQFFEPLTYLTFFKILIRKTPFFLINITKFIFIIYTKGEPISLK